jgi:hypothetical protein
MLFFKVEQEILIVPEMTKYERRIIKGKELRRQRLRTRPARRRIHA